MRSNLHFLTAFFTLLSLGFSHSSLAQFFTSVTTNSPSVGLHEKYEVTMEVNQSFTNPYDPNVVRIYAYMVAPSGAGQEVDAFYFEDFARYADPNYSAPLQPLAVEKYNALPVPTHGEWKVRFAPNEVGTWQCYLVAYVNGAFLTWQTLPSFTCTASSNKGHIRVKDNNYFKFDNGDLYYPVGMNIASSTEALLTANNGKTEWRQGNKYGTYEYDVMFASMGQNGMNYVRIFIDELEKNLIGYDPDGAGRFFDQTLNLKNAKRIDHVMELAEANGIYVHMCFQMAGALTDDLWYARWSGHGDDPTYGHNHNAAWWNSYNGYFGGPCNKPEDFFDVNNAAVMRITKNLYRYIVSRWGYSTNLFSWEFFNEVNQVRKGYYDHDPTTPNSHSAYYPTVNVLPSAYEQKIEDWHIEMKNYLNSIDPNNHLVSTSFAGADGPQYDPGTYQHNIYDAMDFVQYHPYMDHANYDHGAHADFQEFYQRIYDKQKNPLTNGNFPSKPILYSESEYIEVNDERRDISGYSEALAFDPHGLGLHTTLWSSLFQGIGGTPMWWAWRDIDGVVRAQHYQSYHNFPKYHLFGPVRDFVEGQSFLADDNLRYFFDPQANTYNTLTNNPGLRVYSAASSDNKTIAGWVQDINFKFENLYVNKAHIETPAGSNNVVQSTHNPTQNAYLYHLDAQNRPGFASPNHDFVVGNARNGSYTVNWYASDDTQTPFLTESATAFGGELHLNMPAALRNSDFGDAVFSATYDYCGNDYWHLVDIPASITTPNAVDGFVEYQGKFLYRNTSNQVYALWWANFQWNTANVTSLAGAPSDCAGDLTVLGDKVFYRTTSGNLRAIWLNGSWQHTTLDHDLGPLTNVDGGLAVYGSKLFYRTTANGINVIWFDGVWKQSNLSNNIGVLTNVEGDLFTYQLWDKKLFYATSTGDINVIYWDGVWKHGDLSNDIGNLNNLGTQNGDFAQLGDKMFYRTNTNGLNVIWWDDEWLHHDLVNELGTLTDVAGDLTAYADQLFYRSTSGSFRRVWYDHSQSTWVRSDLLPDVADPGNLTGDLEVFDDLLIHRISGNKLEGLIWGNPCKYVTQQGGTGLPGPKKDVADQEVVEEDNVLLFPNPADGSIVTNITKDLKVFSANGALMTPVVTPQAGRVMISTHEWPNGIYIVTGTTESGHPAREKVIILH